MIFFGKIKPMNNKELASALKIIFENTSEGLMICDSFGRILQTSAAFDKLLGYSFAELEGHTTQFLHANPEESVTYSNFTNQLFTTGEFSGDFLYRTKAGDLIALEAKFRSLAGEQNAPTIYLGVFSGTAQYEDREGASPAFNNSYDILTGLLKISPFLNSMETVLKKIARDCSVLSLINIRISGLEEFNQKYGIRRGDNLLCSISQNLKKFCRDSDILGKNTSHSFILAGLDTYTQDNIEKLIEKIINALNYTEGFADNLTYAIGISLYPVSGDNVQSLFDRALFATNQALQKGGNQIFFADTFDNSLFNLPEEK
jgi:PAS domain S-box-containing protein/diguanylate cyclase (GGDEF)-like protein